MEYFPRTYVIGITLKDPEYLESRNIHPGKFGDRIIFMSMFIDINLGQERK